MTHFLRPARTASRPLDGKRALGAASELAREAFGAIAENPANFERAIALLETVVMRYRAGFLTQVHAEAEAARAPVHDRLTQGKVPRLVNLLHLGYFFVIVAHCAPRKSICSGENPPSPKRNSDARPHKISFYHAL